MGIPFFSPLRFPAFSARAAVRAAARSACICLPAVIALSACAGAAPAGTEAAPPPPPALSSVNPPLAVAAAATPAAATGKSAPLPDTGAGIAVCWRPLLARLAADGVDPPYLRDVFSRMGDNYSHLPMGMKITELFTRKFMRPPPLPPDPSQKPVERPRLYRGVVTDANVERCKAYLRDYAGAFSLMEKAYGVPKEIVAALLMVETKLGTYLGKDNAFWSLACMAAADTPKQVTQPLAGLPMTPERLDWVKERLRERSAWAYNELKALIVHSRRYALDPLSMPGSVYGAIGICQFMPSNLRPFAVDGDGDGRVDLFDPNDAIPSVASYLKGHGWKPGMARTQRHAMLMRYNKSTIYANTILALADAINPPADADRAKVKKKPVPAKKAARAVSKPDKKTRSKTLAPAPKAPVKKPAAAARTGTASAKKPQQRDKPRSGPAPKKTSTAVP